MAFITQKDYDEFKDNDDDLDRCIMAFKREMPAFLRARLNDKYENDIKKLECSTTPLETFNEIIKFPSYTGHLILDDLFTLLDEEEEKLLSGDTYSIIGYFYGIHMH